MSDSIIETESISHYYGQRRALNEVSLSVARGECYALLGPNGGGKTTLFKILSTSLLPSSGNAKILGFDCEKEHFSIRSRIGVVFQNASLDKRLKVRENLEHQAHLYGLTGSDLNKRVDELLGRLGLTDRADEIVEKLSGGLMRRLELCKGLIHSPELLLFDEPTTGLDPGGRQDFWSYLNELKNEQELTVLVTTHYMEEADRADRIAFLDRGNLVAEGTPDSLKERIGGYVITVSATDPEHLYEQIKERFGHEGKVVDDAVRLEMPDGPEFVPELVESFPGEIEAVTVGRPTLEDVFVHLTGHQFESVVAE
ncbi:MAG: ABC transporter ATP-binding protein [Planctomycetota bacterium]|jgi:ABC-2 type transport system ATP-binding protein|nr:ABC transporter ATP-binding protein [Planctomycetota bacterium]MDP7129236.1 ABC transporter ATP-binding protein [Planctomycetota bacterium]